MSRREELLLKLFKIGLTLLLFAFAGVGGSVLGEIEADLLAAQLGFRPTPSKWYIIYLLLPGIAVIWYSRRSIPRRIVAWIASALAGLVAEHLVEPLVFAIAVEGALTEGQRLFIATLTPVTGIAAMVLASRVILRSGQHVVAEQLVSVQRPSASEDPIPTEPILKAGSTELQPIVRKKEQLPQVAAAEPDGGINLDSIEARLERLKALYTRGLIEEAAYKERQRQLLSGV